MTHTRTVFYCRNSDIVPSNYYRLAQYVPFLKSNIVIRNTIPTKLYLTYREKKLKSSFSGILINAFTYLVILLKVCYYLMIDLAVPPKYIFVSKTFIPRYDSFIVLFLIKLVSKKTKIVWDFDDNILESHEISVRQFKFLEKTASTILVTNQYLADLLSVSDKVCILPTTDLTLKDIDLKEINKARLNIFSKVIKIIWVGTAGNLKYLQLVVDQLDVAAKEISEKYHKATELIIISEGNFDHDCQYLKIINIKWTRDRAAREILKAHIGIMPLEDNAYTRGKGAFKLIQYMSGGLPIIGSNVGFNKTVVDKEIGALANDSAKSAWLDALLMMVKNGHKWEEYSLKSYKKYQNDFSYKKNINILNNILSGVNK